MRQRVTVVLVARNGADFLPRTLAALAAQTRQPDAIVTVDVGSTDRSTDLLNSTALLDGTALPGAEPATSAVTVSAVTVSSVTVPARTAFGDALAAGVNHATQRDVTAGAEAGDDEWLWLLAHDNAPAPDALQQLLAAVEIAPSVAIAAPKLMHWESPDVIADFGQSVTGFGSAVHLVEDELDQAQHDVSEDVLGAAGNGMLARRSVWSAVGGFDHGLPTVDAGLDFAIRVRLAGHRVVLVPGARVASAGGPETFGRRTVSAARQAHAERRAQLHRRLVYAPAAAVPIHWLSLLPLALFRSFWQLLAKRPAAVPGELAAAIGAAFDGSVARARRILRRNRIVSWKTIAPLRVPWRDVRERRAHRRDAAALADGAERTRARVAFLSPGGVGVIAIIAVAGLLAFAPLLGAAAVRGGALLPLDASVAELWSRIGYGWREIGVGFTGAADPFAYVLATLGTLTFWSPSLSIVLVHLFALPIAAAGAWMAARRLSRTTWVPAVAAVVWAVAPPFLSSLTTGHLGSVIAHMLLPWFALALLRGSRSWPAAASAALLFAVITASAPVLAPVLLAGWVVWMLRHPTGAHRLALVPVLAATLFAPLVVQQLGRGNPLGLLADPGYPAGGEAGSAWLLALGSPNPGVAGWSWLLERFGAAADAAPFVLLGLLLVFLALAGLALFVPGSIRSVPGFVIAVLGFAVAVASTHLSVASVGADTVAVWPGSGLSVLWLGLLTCAIVTLDALSGRRLAPIAGTLLTVTAVAAAAPLLIATLLGAAAIRPASTSIVPAVVAAESKTKPHIGTLTISPAGDGAVTATLSRGLGATLDDQSTLEATSTTPGTAERRLAELAGNLASRSGLDPTAELHHFAIGFVVVGDAAAPPADVAGSTGPDTDTGTTEEHDAVRDRVVDALGKNEHLTHVGQSATGLLWRVTEQPTAAPSPGPANTDTAWGVIVLTAQAAVFVFTLLLAIPTARRHRRVRVSAGSLEDPANTFEDDNV